MAAAARGPSWFARARLCQRRTRRSLAPEPALAVRRLLIGRSETGADWPVPKGRLLATGPARVRFQVLATLPQRRAGSQGLTVPQLP